MDLNKKTPSQQQKTTPAWQPLSWISLHPAVFIPSALCILLAVALTLFAGDAAEPFFVGVRNWITQTTGVFFLVAVNLFLFFMIYIGFSRFGAIRLGGDEAEPEFSRLSWFAMLFSAGMGIGLIFWSVAEPISHFASPPFVKTAPESSLAASQAMRFTYFHWGFHAWGIYALMGLALAYFSFNRNLPLTLRSAFKPLLGKRTDGWMGNTIDTVGVIATLFGVATSLGLGARQVNAGLHHLTGLPQSTTIQVALIAGITLLATISVVKGLDGGIRRLSEWNMVLAGLLLLGVLVLGPTVFLLGSIIQNFGGYLEWFFKLSFWTEIYQKDGSGEPTHWQQGWTIFYWAWWISWSPFVGMFIARISKGRTIREFVLATLIVPVCMTAVWLSVFGNAALHEELFGAGGMVTAVNDNVAVALFSLLERYPWAPVSMGIAVIVIITFFVTSSDSASLVIDIITAGGNPDPPVAQRIFWAVLEGLVAATLLIGGGLKALQAGAIATGLPFAVILIFLAYSLYLGLRNDHGSSPSKINRKST